MTLLCALAVLPVGLWFGVDWPRQESESYPGGVIIRDDSGEVLRVSLDGDDVDCRPFYRVALEDNIVKALVASEDGTFWSHHGVCPMSVMRAVVQNLRGGRRVSGASTITMQAVRLMRPHPKTMWWKIKEAIMAMKLERERDKLWILTQYLNRVPFGSNLVGIEAAAQGWFGKGAKELGLGEAAMLAGMVQAPSRYRPDRGYDRALKRRDYVFDRMLTQGMIDKYQLEAARSVFPVVRRAPRPFKAPHFCDWVMRNSRTRDEITSLNADIQRLCEDAVASASTDRGYSSSALVLRVADGAVLGMACSGDYFDRNGGQVNTALSRRPAGSTLKPFLSALALDRGIVTPDSLLQDSPVSFKGYRPVNFDGKCRGPVSLRDSLVLSLNIPFVRLLERIRVSAFGDNLRSLGFSGLRHADDSAGFGMAIGNVEVSLLELVSAYAVLARGGTTDSGEREYALQSCLQIADMLSGAERSDIAFGHVGDVFSPRFAWKTGTSSAYRDAWTVAWNPEYVVGVWCGHKSGGFGDGSLVGAKAAAPVCWRIARQLYPRNSGPWFESPTAQPHVRTAVDLPKQERLTIIKPENPAEVMLVEGSVGQAVVFQTTGSRSTLWWFLNGEPVGETKGNDKFSLQLPQGNHIVTCTTDSGESASVAVSCIVPAGE